MQLRARVWPRFTAPRENGFPAAPKRATCPPPVAAERDAAMRRSNTAARARVAPCNTPSTRSRRRAKTQDRGTGGPDARRRHDHAPVTRLKPEPQLFSADWPIFAENFPKVRDCSWLDSKESMAPMQLKNSARSSAGGGLSTPGCGSRMFAASYGDELLLGSGGQNDRVVIRRSAACALAISCSFHGESRPGRTRWTSMSTSYPERWPHAGLEPTTLGERLFFKHRLHCFGRVRARAVSTGASPTPAGPPRW